MTSDLSNFATRLREQLSHAERGTRNAEMAGHQTAARGFSETDFNQLALELYALQFARNPIFRRVCEARRLSPEAVEHWRHIPAVPTATFKEFDVTCLPPAERTHVFHSSGTTEQRPSRNFHCAESLAAYEASLWPWFARHVLPDLNPNSEAAVAAPSGSTGHWPVPSGDPPLGTGKAHELFRALVSSAALLPVPSGQWPDGTGGSLVPPIPTSKFGCKSQISNLKLAVLTPPPAQTPYSSLVHMFETVRRKLRTDDAAFCGMPARDGAWELDLPRTLAHLREATERGVPLVLLGTAFSFVHLLDFLTEQNLRFELPPGSRVMETGGYKGRSRALSKAELHALITNRLAIPASHIVCEYGMSELSSEAYDRVASGVWRVTSADGAACHPSPVTRHFRFPPWARAQVISPETGREVADGETGLLRMFDLANVWSVMAIQTEDLGVRRGDGFELIGRAALVEPRGCSLMAA